MTSDKVTSDKLTSVLCTVHCSVYSVQCSACCDLVTSDKVTNDIVTREKVKIREKI